MPLPRFLAGVVVAAVLSIPLSTAITAPAHAVPQTDDQTTTETLAAAALVQQVRENRRAMAVVSRQAQRRQRVLVGQREVFAQYGFTGDPSDATAVLPIATYNLSAGFGASGPLWEATHGGQDFGATSGTPLVAVADATVTEVADAGPYGLRTILTLKDGTEIWYCHQDSVQVVAGERVDIATEIGVVGSTGNSTGPHLHLEVRPEAGSPVDPMTWLRSHGLNP